MSNVNARVFEYSKNLKHRWLFMPKSKDRIADGVSMPGLFETSNMTWLYVGFFITLILEGYVTYLGRNQGVNWLMITFTIFADMALACVSHYWQAEICRYKNIEVFANEATQQQQKALRQKRERLQFFFKFLILVLGVVKCYLFYSVYLRLDFKLFSVFLVYMGGAVLHILYTGYVFYHLLYYFPKKRSEEGQFITSARKDFVGEERKSQFESSVQLNEVDIKQGNILKHHLKFLKENDKKFVYELTTLGILEDIELITMINGQISSDRKQNSDQRICILKEGIRHQIQSIYPSDCLMNQN